MSKPYDTSQHREAISNEHFWFTATMLGVNGFLISQDEKLATPVLVWIGLLNLFAIFLILHRSASYAGKLRLPEKVAKKAQPDRGFADKARETALNIRISLSHIPFVVGEASGTLFYICLIATSFIGVALI